MKHLILSLLFILFISQAFSQDYAAWQSAFEESYALEAEGNYQGALEVLEDGFVDNSYEFNIRYGWLYYNLGDYPTSKKYYKKAMELMPYSHQAKFGYVLPLAGLGEWAEVISIYKKMLQTDPKNTVVNYRLGAIYYEMKDYQPAYNYLEEVINLYPNDYDSNLLFAWTNYQMGKLKEAKVLFNKVLLIKPGDESAEQGLSLIQ
jgi:tetratricopeptide (TPR) repeat protein